MISRIDATNYRCFERLGINFGAFAVVAGSNGSGKTTLLDIPMLLGDLLRSRNVAQAFVARMLGRGARATSLTEVPFRSERNSFTLGIEAKLPDHIATALVDAAPAPVRHAPDKHPTHIRYELRLEVESGNQITVRNEYLFVFPLSESYELRRLPMQGENADQDDWRFILKRDVHSEQTSEVVIRPETKGAKEKETQVDRTVAALPRLQYEAEMEFAAGRWLLDQLLTGGLFFDPKWTELRAAAPPGLDRTLMASGENLPWLALGLFRNDPERFAMWVGHVQTALPQISDISVHEREEDHHAYFRVTYEGGFSVTSSGLSEGTLRIMAFTLVAYLLDPPSLLVVEEPENSVHPQAIEAIMQSLRSLYDGQVWVSTHSPVVLADGELSDLVISRLERSGAATVLRGVDHPRLAQWKGAIDLGSLFATGVFE
ncbi:methylation-associated defense system AAA family ATPase MAD3 [Gemmatimonas sp. UBA7669]|uniref:methylation-associated defense system AAA family ATPase MAD3 n=1 Tax=Gemmatimonas sp. UBA7669 TaxID=1946568 RepID=UPI0025BA5A94|nr:AAA family ATPase [Gemmatimonas sp. UBA7669]